MLDHFPNDFEGLAREGGSKSVLRHALIGQSRLGRNSKIGEDRHTPFTCFTITTHQSELSCAFTVFRDRNDFFRDLSNPSKQANNVQMSPSLNLIAVEARDDGGERGGSGGRTDTENTPKPCR